MTTSEQEAERAAEQVFAEMDLATEEERRRFDFSSLWTDPSAPPITARIIESRLA